MTFFDGQKSSQIHLSSETFVWWSNVLLITSLPFDICFMVNELLSYIFLRYICFIAIFSITSSSVIFVSWSMIFLITFSCVTFVSWRSSQLHFPLWHLFHGQRSSQLYFHLWRLFHGDLCNYICFLVNDHLRYMHKDKKTFFRGILHFLSTVDVTKIRWTGHHNEIWAENGKISPLFLQRWRAHVDSKARKKQRCRDQRIYVIMWCYMTSYNVIIGCVTTLKITCHGLSSWLWVLKNSTWEQQILSANCEDTDEKLFGSSHIIFLCKGFIMTSNLYGLKVFRINNS